MSILRSYKAKTAKGRSLGFLVIVEAGFAVGILQKIYFSYDLSVCLYALNIALVLIDIVVWRRNRKLDRQWQEENQNSKDHFFV
jgi:hypothetical protein